MVVYDWPGNVRQLCNEVRRIVTYSDSGSIVTPESLSREIAQSAREPETDSGSHRKLSEVIIAEPAHQTLAEAMEDLERKMIQEALRNSSGNIARAAKELGLSRKGLYLKMDRLNFNG